MRANLKKTSQSARTASALRGGSRRSVELPVSQHRRRSRRGFAAMDPALQRRIARQGGRAVSKNRKHMARIGRIGGRRRGAAKA